MQVIIAVKCPIPIMVNPRFNSAIRVVGNPETVGEIIFTKLGNIINFNAFKK